MGTFYDAFKFFKINLNSLRIKTKNLDWEHHFNMWKMEDGGHYDEGSGDHGGSGDHMGSGDYGSGDYGSGEYDEHMGGGNGMGGGMGNGMGE